MRLFKVFYGGTSKKDLNDIILAETAEEAIIKFIREHKGRVFVFGTEEIL